MLLTRLARILTFAGFACLGLSGATIVGLAEPYGKSVPLSMGLAGAGTLLLVCAYAAWGHSGVERAIGSP